MRFQLGDGALVKVRRDDVVRIKEVVDLRLVRNLQTGLLIPPGRPDVASRALLDFVGNAELRRRCADQARMLLTREFEIRQMVRRLDRLYLEGLEDQLPLGGVAGDGILKKIV